MMRRYAPLKQRFMEKCAAPDGDGCINWIGAKNKKNGYGHIFSNGRLVVATKLAYEWSFGRVPDGLRLRHKCDNPGCVNPNHLVPGTQQENLDDMVRRGRQKRSRYNCVDVERMRDLARHNVTQSAIAEHFGCAQPTVSMLLSGLTKPKEQSNGTLSESS